MFTLTVDDWLSPRGHKVPVIKSIRECELQDIPYEDLLNLIPETNEDVQKVVARFADQKSLKAADEMLKTKRGP